VNWNNFAVKDYYKILGLAPDASEDSIRRAYRILARRYHPDVNPGDTSSEKFKSISEAYKILNNQQSRNEYDAKYLNQEKLNFKNKIKAYKRTQEKQVNKSATERYYQAQKQDYERLKKVSSINPQANSSRAKIQSKQQSAGFLNNKTTINLINKLSGFLHRNKIHNINHISKPDNNPDSAEAKYATPKQLSKLSIVEASISIKEAVLGTSKNIELDDGNVKKRFTINIPPGSRTGSFFRIRQDSPNTEEVVVIIKVLRHPYLSIDPRGLIIEVPITVGEAISGANIKIPTLEDETLVKIPANVQSGFEIRLKEKGMVTAEGRGDLFVKVMINIPDSSNAVGIKEKANEIDLYYSTPVRNRLSGHLLS